jgi:uncharacterized protein (DUF488 family)
MPERIAYTAGYLGHSPGELRAAAERLGAFVVDIRFSATSRDPRWRGNALALSCGCTYMALPTLGNVNYKTGGPIEIADLEGGIAALESVGRPAPQGLGLPILLCACRDAATCHRAVVAKALRARGWRVEELDWEGADHARP